MSAFWMFAGTLAFGLGWMLVVPSFLAWLDGKWENFKDTYACYQTINVVSALLIGFGTVVLLSS